MKLFKIKHVSNQLKYYLSAIILFLFLLSACNNDEYSSDVYTASQDTLVPNTDINQNVSAVAISVDTLERVGPYLTDKNGRTLYMFKGDQRGKSSNCYLNCAEAWPPLLTTSKISASAPSVNAKMFGTIMRKDSSLQVTYNGWPLYYYKKDKTSGSIKGQDVNGFGGEWYIISPNGSYVAPGSNENPQSQQEENNQEQIQDQ